MCWVGVLSLLWRESSQGYCLLEEEEDGGSAAVLGYIGSIFLERDERAFTSSVCCNNGAMCPTIKRGDNNRTYHHVQL